MKQIVLVEDNMTDRECIKELIATQLPEFAPYLTCLSSLSEASRFFRSHDPDLVIMDLEFTEENTTSISFLSEAIINIPVIIVSHLSHYQNTLSEYVDVKAFIRKENLHSRLIPTLIRCLSPQSNKETPQYASFPSRKHLAISEKILADKIRFIEKIGRYDYRVWLTDNTSMILSSIYFSDLCLHFEKTGLFQLKPISRNEIINIHCIERIQTLYNGRLEVHLINLPDRVFHAGDKYKEYFSQTFL